MTAAGDLSRLRNRLIGCWKQIALTADPRRREQLLVIIGRLEAHIREAEEELPGSDDPV
jgi:hypothetical protein